MPDPSRPIVVEICVDDVGGTAAARGGGADRVELCGLVVEVVGAACSM